MTPPSGKTDLSPAWQSGQYANGFVAIFVRVLNDRASGIAILNGLQSHFIFVKTDDFYFAKLPALSKASRMAGGL